VASVHLVAVLVLLLVAGVLVLLPRNPVQARSFVLLRSLFPAWRFFEAIAELPRLSFRYARATGNATVWGAWTQVPCAPARTASSLMLNAGGNLQLACHALLEHLESELESAELTPSALVSYRLVQNWVEGLVSEATHAVEATEYGVLVRYQFRLTTMETHEELLLSQEHELTRVCASS